MTEGRLYDLLPLLIERTRRGRMGWSPLPTEGDNAFVHLLPGGAGSLVVRRQFSTFQVELRNASDDQLESVGELQQVPEVATLWQVIDSMRRPAADPYAALDRELGA